MRTHKQIIEEHGALRLSRDLVARGVKVHFSTPQRWSERENIPGQYWPILMDMGIAGLDELVAGVKPRKPSEKRNKRLPKKAA